MLSSAPGVILSIPDDAYSWNSITCTKFEYLRFYFKTNYYVIMISVLIVIEFVGILFSLFYTGDNNILRCLFYPLYYQVKWEILLVFAVFAVCTFVLHFLNMWHFRLTGGRALHVLLLCSQFFNFGKFLLTL